MAKTTSATTLRSPDGGVSTEPLSERNEERKLVFTATGARTLSLKMGSPHSLTFEQRDSEARFDLVPLSLDVGGGTATFESGSLQAQGRRLTLGLHSETRMAGANASGEPVEIIGTLDLAFEGDRRQAN